LNANVTAALVDGLVTTSDEARALSCALREMGQNELSILWDRFADFLVATENYLGPPALD
jgi:hypothetical protein